MALFPKPKVQPASYIYNSDTYNNCTKTYYVKDLCIYNICVYFLKFGFLWSNRILNNKEMCWKMKLIKTPIEYLKSGDHWHWNMI